MRCIFFIEYFFKCFKKKSKKYHVDDDVDKQDKQLINNKINN